MKCWQCATEHAKDDAVVQREAVTQAPHMQVMQTSMGVVAGVVALPVCAEHLSEQAGKSKSGLAIA